MEKEREKERMKLVVVCEIILVTRKQIFYSSESFQAVPARPSGTNTLYEFKAFGDKKCRVGEWPVLTRQQGKKLRTSCTEVQVIP